MKLSKKKPKIYDRIKATFPSVEWDRGLIITYGDTVHCKFDIGPHKEVHEGVHVKQQLEMGKEKWWDMYIEYPAFRLLQEIEAYTAEVAFMRDHTELTTRDQRRHYLKQIVENMSGPMYGNICTRKQAEQLFR